MRLFTVKRKHRLDQIPPEVCMIKASYPFKSLIGCRETQFQLHKNTDYYLKHNISSLFCTKCLNVFFNERVNIDFYKGANRYNLVKFLLLEKKGFFLFV